MNDKCKYCSYVSKCSERCEYNSILCLLNRRIPKIVNKSYEELEKENQELNNKIEELVKYAYGTEMSLGEFKGFYRLATGKEYDPNKGLEAE